MSVEIKKIGIIGEGKMGSSLFQFLMNHPFRLYWLCSSEEGKERALNFLRKKLKILVHSGLISDEEALVKTGTMTITDNIADLKDCDLVIEAINEDLLMKVELFQALDRAVNPSCIFTSNSSSLLPSRLIPSERRRDKFAGMHFFFPVNLKNTVELISGPETSEETLAALRSFLSSLNKKAFSQEESHAFLLNRLLLDFQAGAYNILLEGKLTMKEIDDLVKTKFFPVGVFEFFDHVGIDVMLASIKTYTEKAPNPDFYAPLLAKMQQLADQGQLGIKTKQGFYIHCKSLGDIRKEESEVFPSKEYLKDVENRLLTYIMDSANSIMDKGIDCELLSDALMDYLGMDKDPFRTLISNC